MYNGNKSLFANSNVDISRVIEKNDIYNSSFIAKMMHDRINVAKKEVIETDTRLDIFVQRVAPDIDQSVIQLINKIVDWDDVKVGDFLYVPTTTQISEYSTRS